MLHIHVSVQWHDEIDDAHGYEMKCNFVGAKHLGCYSWLAQLVVLELCLWLMKNDLLFNMLLACAFHLFMVIFF